MPLVVSTTQIIMEMVRDTVQGLVFPGLNISTVLIRKRLVVQDADVLPIVVITPGQPRVESEHTENVVVWQRPVWVAIATPTGDGLLETNFDLMGYEQLIRLALYKPTFAGAPTVFNVDVEPEAMYIPGGVDTGYDLTILQFIFWSQEPRSI